MAGVSMIEEIEQLWAPLLAGLPPPNEIPRWLHCGHDAYIRLLREAAGPGLASPPPVHWANGVDIVLGGDTSTPDEWILYAADGSEMKRGHVTLAAHKCSSAHHPPDSCKDVTQVTG